MEDQGLVKVDLSAILDPFDSSQFAVSLGYVILSKLCPAPFLPVSKSSWENECLRTGNPGGLLQHPTRAWD